MWIWVAAFVALLAWFYFTFAAVKMDVSVAPAAERSRRRTLQHACPPTAADCGAVPLPWQHARHHPEL
jgi:hypothetical protein